MNFLALFLLLGALTDALALTAVPSTACEIATTTTASVATNLRLEFEVAGVARELRVHVAAGLGRTPPPPLVMQFHGGGARDPYMQEHLSQLANRSATLGVAVASMAGVGIGAAQLLRTWNAGACCGAQPVDDVAYVRAALVNLDKRICFDRARVYATGFSNGGQVSCFSLFFAFWININYC